MITCLLSRGNRWKETGPACIEEPQCFMLEISTAEVFFYGANILLELINTATTQHFSQSCIIALVTVFKSELSQYTLLFGKYPELN